MTSDRLIERIGRELMLLRDADDPRSRSPAAWLDWRPNAFESRRHAALALRAGLKRSNSDDLDVRLLDRELKLFDESLEFALHAYPVNQLMGVPNQVAGGLRIPFYLTTQQPLRGRDDFERYLELTHASAVHLRSLADRVRTAHDQGIAPPAEVLGATLIVIDDLLGGANLSDHPVALAFRAGLANCPDVSSDDRARWVAQLEREISESLVPGLQAIRAAVLAMQARPRRGFGVCTLPHGAAFYAHCLERWCGAAESPEALHALGLEQLTMLEDEIRVLTGAGASRRTFRELIGDAWSDASKTFPADALGEERSLSRAVEITQRLERELHRVTSRRPAARLEIRATEPFRRRGAMYAEFYPGAADGSRPSLYYINTGTLAGLARSELVSLTFHEGIPGHHLQICSTLADTRTPAFRRTPFCYESYCEGWAMYAEQLGFELIPDAVTNDDRLGCLTRRLWMAARLVIDTGIHAMGWTRDQALATFLERTCVPRGAAERELDRYAVWPGQATAYHVGYLAFATLRRSREQAEGSRFDLRAFHDRLFEVGPVPADLLREAFRTSSAG